MPMKSLLFSMFISSAPALAEGTVLTYGPDAAMAQALALTLANAGAPETSEPVSGGTSIFGDVLLTQSAFVGSFLVACKTKIIGPNSRAPREVFLGCEAAETTTKAADLPVLSLKDLLTLAQPQAEL